MRTNSLQSNMLPQVKTERGKSSLGLAFPQQHESLHHPMANPYAQSPQFLQSKPAVSPGEVLQQPQGGFSFEDTFLNTFLA